MYVAGSFANTAGSFLLAKYTDVGSSAGLAWTQQAGNAGATAVSVAGTGLYAAGNASLPATFGSHTLTGPVGTNNAMFAASLANGSLATHTMALAAGIRLFPNPAHNVATLWLPAVSGAPWATLTLFDMLGHAVRSREIALPTTSTTAELSVVGLAPGLYYLHVQAGE